MSKFGNKFGGTPVFVMVGLVLLMLASIIHPAAASVLHVHGTDIALGAAIFGTLYPLEFRKFWHSMDQVWYTNANAVVVDTPIWVAGFGALVPIVSTDAATAGPYRRFGVFSGTITAGITIAQCDPVFYITATGLVTNVDPTTNGFLLGMADVDGTAPAGFVDIILNAYAMPTSTAVACTSLTASGNAAISGTASIGGALAVTGVTTQTGALNVTGAITGASTAVATKINATAGRVTDKQVVTAVNATGPVSAAAIIGGIITSTSAAAVAATLDSAANIWALIPGAVVGTVVTVKVSNTAGSAAVTVTLPGSITNRSGVAGDLVVGIGAVINFTIIFTSSTAADIYRG